MVRWVFKSGDILDEPADVLICSANVFLNLSGGVGGAILLRMGDAMQRWLHARLAEQNRHFVQQGEVIESPPFGLPYRAVLHAVAIDGMYESTPDTVRSVVRKSLHRAATMNARSVSLTALATGYGKLTIGQFAQALRPLLAEDFAPVERVAVCVRNAMDLAELQAVLDVS